MRRGAIAFVDALGFKGIWKRADPSAVVGKLKELQKKTTEIVLSFQEETETLVAGPQPELRYAFISDSVVVGAFATDETSQAVSDWASVTLASYAVSALISLAAHNKPTLAYRGAISVGEFEFDPPFFVGPALDEAAEWEKQNNAAVVSFSESARRVVQDAVAERGNLAASSRIWMPWTVELKDKPSEDTYAVVPFYPGRESDRSAGMKIEDNMVKRLTTEILATFDSDRPDVQAKRENTAKFLKAAADYVLDPGS